MSNFPSPPVLEPEYEAALSFADITPPNLPFGPDEKWATAAFGGAIYLAWISLDSAKKRDIRRIYRYAGKVAGWETVYLQTVSFGRAVRREGSAIQIDFASRLQKGKPMLLVRFLSPQGLNILKSTDGREFTVTEQEGTDEAAAFDRGQSLQVGAAEFRVSSGASGNILQTRSAAEGTWQDAALPAGTVGSVSTLTIFQNQPVISVDNEKRGFELLRQESGEWKTIISRGGQRFTLNGKVFQSVVWQDALYLICGSSGNVDPNAQPGFEVLRVYPDWSWDVVIGALHITATGLKIPLTGLGPGTDEFEPASCQFLATAKVGLLLGTYEVINGLRVWHSENGTDWDILPNNGLSGSGQLLSTNVLSTPDRTTLALDLEDLSKGRTLSIWQSV